MTQLTPKIITRILVVSALAVSPARAYCYYDSFGYYQCNNDLSYTARVLIGLGILAFCLALVGGIFMRRRSITRARNLAYLQTQQQQPGQFPPPQPGAWGNQVPVGPSYPPKNEYPGGYPGGFITPQEPPKTYNPGQPAYPPGSTSPPGYFDAPQGAPPAVNNGSRPNQPPIPYHV